MLNWYYPFFNDLTLPQLYDLLALRSQVFVHEQQCCYQDLDYKDQMAHHLLGYDENQTLQAYARCYELDDNFIAIGRVLVAKEQRHRGTGRELMTQALHFCKAHYPDHPAVRINAQHYLLSFYQSLQFTVCGEPFDEEGILHIRMERTL
jgi:ElaA protein